MRFMEKKVFIEDSRPNMSTEEKNQMLSTELRVHPHDKRNIFRIERVEIGASGWLIRYRAASSE